MAAVLASAEPARDDRQTSPWWTEADQAELEALVWELVDGLFEHREKCASCVRAKETGGIPCPHIRKAIEVVTNWHRARDLRSYARWLRLQRDLFELEQDVIRHKAGR